MSVNIKLTGGLNIEWGQIDPKATGGLRCFETALRCLEISIVTCCQLLDKRERAVRDRTDAAEE